MKKTWVNGSTLGLAGLIMFSLFLLLQHRVGFFSMSGD